MIELVNGFPCHNCTDVELAKKGIDPARPQEDPRSPGYPSTADAASVKPLAARGAAVTFGGSLEALNAAQSVNADSTSGKAPRSQRPGTTLDISA